MLINILKNEAGKSIGWEMSGENPEEIKKLGTIRDLTFWGVDDTVIEYNGRRESNDAEGNPGILTWKQKGTILKQ
jgi:hypothetical protein